MKMQRGGQMKLSFGMIFSIILMVVFMAFAFYAIQKFLELQNSIQVAKFSRDLQEDIDKMWKGSQGVQQQEYFLPSKIKYACIIDYSGPNEIGRYENFYNELNQFYSENENLFFYPPGSAQGFDAKWIKHIDLEKITNAENPFCFENIKGKTKIIIKKEFGEALVTLIK